MHFRRASTGQDGGCSRFWPGTPAGSAASELADRSILSVGVLFLAAGVVLGPAGSGVLAITTDSPVVIRLSEYALFSVLFTDGMKIPLRDLSQRRHLREEPWLSDFRSRWW